MELGLLEPTLKSIAEGLSLPASVNGAISVMPLASRNMFPETYLAASVQTALGLTVLSHSEADQLQASNQVIALLADAKQSVMSMGVPCVFDHWAADPSTAKASLHRMRIQASDELGGAWLIHH